MADVELSPEVAGPPAAAKAHVKLPEGRKQITTKIKAAVDAIVWQGLDWQDAARNANLSVRRMRTALEKPHVIRYLKQQKQVFRASASGQNIHRAVEIRDQQDNQTARIQAIRYLDGLSDGERADGANKAVQPGVVVVVNVDRSPAQVDEAVIEINPGGAGGDGETS